MATRKTTVKATRKAAAKAPRKSTAKAARKTAARAPAAAKQAKAAKGDGTIRVRMYRVGFGDFFLLTVPGKQGPAHILIDCGVHAADIHSIGD